MSKHLRAFLFEGVSKNGYPIVGGGIAAFDKIKEARSAFDKIEEVSLSIKDIDDSFLIDYELARSITSIAPKCVYAVGASIHVAGASGPTGGIIGNPHKEISSAEGLAEDIGNGLSLAAYPGGPGLLIKGSIDLAEMLLKVVKPHQNDKASLLNIIDALSKQDVTIGIVISDGTGASECGHVIVYEEDRISILSNSGW